MKYLKFSSYKALLSLIFIFYTLSATAAETEKQQELVFLSWSEYMDPALLQAFTKQHNIAVKEVFFESDQVRTEMLLRTQGRGYDVVLVVGADMATYRKRGWLAAIDDVQVPNLKHVNPRWQEAFEQAPKGYGVPYLWGGLGILYNKDKFTTPVNSWQQLFKPEPRLKGRILILRNNKDVLGLALKSLGYSYNSSNRSELKAVKKLLLAQKPFVGSYSVAILNKTSGFVTGDYWMGMSYNGDALMLKDLNPQLKFVIPQEGTALWCDYLTIMQTSENKAAAFKFIDFMNQPKNAAQLAQYVRYASPNQAAEKLLPPEYLSNPLIYPSKAVLERSETGIALPPRINKTRTSIYNQLLH